MDSHEIAFRAIYFGVPIVLGLAVAAALVFFLLLRFGVIRFNHQERQGFDVTPPAVPQPVELEEKENDHG